MFAIARCSPGGGCSSWDAGWYVQFGRDVIVFAPGWSGLLHCRAIWPLSCWLACRLSPGGLVLLDWGWIDLPSSRLVGVVDIGSLAPKAEVLGLEAPGALAVTKLVLEGELAVCLPSLCPWFVLGPCLSFPFFPCLGSCLAVNSEVSGLLVTSVGGHEEIWASMEKIPKLPNPHTHSKFRPPNCSNHLLMSVAAEQRWGPWPSAILLHNCRSTWKKPSLEVCKHCTSKKGIWFALKVFGPLLLIWLRCAASGDPRSCDPQNGDLSECANAFGVWRVSR